LFIQFLRQRARRSQGLYILGDLFEVWIGEDHTNPLQKCISHEIQTLTENHVPVYFMAGNRDFLIQQSYAQQTGWQMLDDPSCVNIHGETILLTHGDALCTLDDAHQRFRRLTRQKWLQQLFLALPLHWRRAMANKIRQKSMQRGKMLEQAIQDVEQLAVQTLMDKFNTDVMIHGHTHRPQIHKFTHANRSYERIVLGGLA